MSEQPAARRAFLGSLMPREWRLAQGMTPDELAEARRAEADGEAVCAFGTCEITRAGKRRLRHGRKPPFAGSA